MSNPFPGMNPYLEGDLWSDLHNRLASSISIEIIPFIRPKYQALIAPYVVKSDLATMGSNAFYPDVAIIRNEVKEPMIAYGNQPQITKASLSVPVYVPIEVKIPVIEIRKIKGKELITVIEILSPANKYGKGFQQYQEKRKALIPQKVNFLEIDLLRRGKRTIVHPEVEHCDYLCALTRKGENKTDLWTLDLQEKLPVLPIPLEEGDSDVAIDLQQVLNDIYQGAYYGDTIDYTEKVPPPKLSKEKRQWIQNLISKKTNAK